jgi:hypothetical protein
VQLDRRNRRDTDKKLWPGKMMGRLNMEHMCVN